MKKSLALEISDGVIGLLLLVLRPSVDMRQDVDTGGALGFDAAVLIVAEDGTVHGGEIDDGDGEGAVHVENDASERRFGGGGGHSARGGGVSWECGGEGEESPCNGCGQH